MRKFACIWFLFLTFSQSSFGQSKLSLDSLKEVAQHDTTSVSNKLDIYFYLARQYMRVDSTQTANNVYSALELAEKHSLDDRKVEALNQLGWMNVIRTNHEVARHFYDSSLAIARKNNDAQGQLDAYKGLGGSASYQGQHDSARIFYEKSLVYAIETGKQNRIAGAYNSLAGIQVRKGNNPEALRLFQNALKAYKEIGYKIGPGYVLRNIGVIYENQRNYQKALESNREALALFKEGGSERGTAESHFIIGTLYNTMGKYDSALIYINRSLEVVLKLRKESPLRHYRELGSVHSNMEQYDSAIYYTEKSLKIARDRRLPVDELNALTTLAGSYQGLKKYRVAQSLARKAVNIGESLGRGDYQVSAYSRLAQVERAMGNYKLALDAYLKYSAINDSLIAENQVEEVTELRAQFRFDQERDSIRFANEKEILAKNNEITLLATKEQNANLKITILIISISLIIIIGFLVSRMLLMRKEKKKKELEEISQFKEAMTGMIAHDLKNPLSLILNSPSESENTHYSAKQMLQLINNLLDVHKFESTTVQLKKVSFDLHYVATDISNQLRPLLDAHNLQLDLQIPQEQTVDADKEIIERVLINLLTNAIKYSPANGVITVRSEENDEKVVLSVVDQGQGIPADKIKTIFESFGQADPKMSGGVASTGLGLTFCKLAARAHGSEIQVDSKVGAGTTFYFSLEKGSKEVNGAATDQDGPFVFSMTKEEKTGILEGIKQLKLVPLHEATRIEEILGEFKSEDNDQVNKWAEAVLEAAYSFDQEHYDELLELVED